MRLLKATMVALECTVVHRFPLIPGSVSTVVRSHAMLPGWGCLAMQMVIARMCCCPVRNVAADH